MKKNSRPSHFFLYVSILGLLGVLLAFLAWYRQMAGPSMILLFSSLAIFCMGHPVLKSFAFTVWVFAFVAASMYYPSAFGKWFGFDLGNLIVPLIQIIMFGMGTTLCFKDFSRVLTMPFPVLVGMVLQFTVMPLAGYSIAILLSFEPEVAAGIILTGSVPGGVASNLMTYLAGGNVALSVTMTSCSTLLSPVMTPFLMKTLAGKLVPIDFIVMMLSILDMTIVPIIAGLFANRILYSRRPWTKRIGMLAGISAAGLLLAAGGLLLRSSSWGPFFALKNGIMIGFFLIGLVALARMVVSGIMKRQDSWMDKALPVVSMSGICFIIAIITARSSEKLLSVGGLLILAAIMHNTTGYILGYWLSRAVRLDEKTSRTVSFEVGMQNGGMASGLAMNVLKSASAALAPAIFGPWMNISGSILATWWHRKKNRGDHETP